MPNDLNHKPIDRIEYAKATMPIENRADALIKSIVIKAEKMAVDLIDPRMIGKETPKLHPHATLFIANAIKTNQAAIHGHEFTQLSSLDMPTEEDLAPVKVLPERMAMRFAFLNR